MALIEILYWLGTGTYRTKTERLQLAAEKGSVRAQRVLGECYFFGQGVPDDPAEAVKWFRKAAAQGDSHARFYLGYAHMTGAGTVKDEENAYAWFDLAASRGHGKAAAYKKKLIGRMPPEQLAEAGIVARELGAKAGRRPPGKRDVSGLRRLFRRR